MPVPASGTFFVYLHSLLTLKVIWLVAPIFYWRGGSAFEFTPTNCFSRQFDAKFQYFETSSPEA